MSLPSFLPPTVGVYSLAWSSAWKLTGAKKVSQIFSSFCHSFPPSLCLSSFFSWIGSRFSFWPRQPWLFSLWLADILPVVSPSSLLSSSAGLHFSPSAFFHVCLNDGRLQLFSNTGRSLFPDEAAYSNHCLASARPPLQLHNLGSNSTVRQNKVQNFAWFGLALCQVMIGPRCVFPPNGSFCWLLIVLRVSCFICVCDLVWYDSFCFGKETFFLKQELHASSVIKHCRLSLQLYLKLIKRCGMCLRLCTAVCGFLRVWNSI